MKTIKILFAGTLMVIATGCQKYLDVNNNPNGPSSADPALYLPPIQTNLATAIMFDARLIGPYTQNFLQAAAGGTYDQHGYVRGSDFGGELWRNVYWKGGLNLLDMINGATEQKRWDVVGAGLALTAWGWQNLTDYHGPIILTEAFDPSKNTFNYDEQAVVYSEVEKIARNAIRELDKTGDGVGSVLFNRYDLMYAGDREKWKKFAYGVLALNYHHLSNKAGYKPDSVIAFVDKSLASNADNATVPYAGNNSTDGNFFGPIRNNLGSYGQSAFIVRLTDGSIFGSVDPRRNVMLAPSGDGEIRGLTPGSGQSSTVSGSASGVPNLWGSRLGVGSSAGQQGRYLFQNNARFPLMTFAMLQFIKAEAAFLKGDKSLALTAYTAGLNGHLDYVRTFASNVSEYNALRNDFLANPEVLPTDPNELTLNDILLQKYIALWGYGFIETWSDLRRYNYDPNVFTSFALPTTFFADNNGQPAYRVRPRYNSEYLWNIDALTSIGGFDLDYHTKPLWFHQP